MAENEERRVEAEKQSSNAKRSDKAANDEHRVTRHDAEQESGHCKDSYCDREQIPPRHGRSKDSRRSDRSTSRRSRAPNPRSKTKYQGEVALF